jgi:hypothetical protein
MSMPPRLIQPVYEEGMEYERRVEFDMSGREGYRSSSPPERPRMRMKDSNKDKERTREKDRKENSMEKDLRRETFKERRGGLPPPSVLVGYKYPTTSSSQQPKSILKQRTAEGYPSPPFAQPGIPFLYKRVDDSSHGDFVRETSSSTCCSSHRYLRLHPC